MSIDREAALKKAEKLLRQGKLDGAIEEYERLIEDQPRDWSAINALGDLYARAGHGDRAVTQFTRVADHLFAEGFLPKAAALYKKALKVRARDERTLEHTLSQLAEIGARQGLLADARTYLRQLVDQRRARGDERGVAECLSRLRALDDTTPEPAAPVPAGEAPASAGAVGLDDGGHLFAAAQRELAAGNDLQARAILTRVLTLDPGRHGDVTGLALELGRDGDVESAFGCIDVVTDAALLEGEWDRAVTVLETFVRAVPHVPALIKLVELCVDAGLDAPLRAAQAQLADAYLAEGRGPEARFIAEDLLEHDPDCDGHALRLQRALELLGLAPGDSTTSGECPEDAELLDSIEVDLSDALAGIDAPSPEPRADSADPCERARAAAAQGRLHIERGDLQAGVDWLERAADGPTATPDEGFALLYELAEALERLGETSRALAVLIDLDADAGEYRDVRARIEHLARAQAGSHGR